MATDQSLEGDSGLTAEEREALRAATASAEKAMKRFKETGFVSAEIAIHEGNFYTRQFQKEEEEEEDAAAPQQQNGQINPLR